MGDGLRVFVEPRPQTVQNLVGAAGFKLAVELSNQNVLGASGELAAIRGDHLRGGRGRQQLVERLLVEPALQGGVQDGRFRARCGRWSGQKLVADRSPCLKRLEAVHRPRPPQQRTSRNRQGVWSVASAHPPDSLQQQGEFPLIERGQMSLDGQRFNRVVAFTNVLGFPAFGV